LFAAKPNQRWQKQTKHPVCRMVTYYVTFRPVQWRCTPSIKTSKGFPICHWPHN
jgi:hypothetical protein